MRAQLAATDDDRVLVEPLIEEDAHLVRARVRIRVRVRVRVRVS